MNRHVSHDYIKVARPPKGHRAYARHLCDSPWLTVCTCRDDKDGGTFYTCRRAACFGTGKACGGYCRACFAEKMRRAGDEREVVVLCGSSRFYEAFQQANYDLTMQGKIVLSIGFFPHSKAEHGHGEGVGHDSAEKIALDELHKIKINKADRVLVLNVGGYIGESTRSEIEHAQWAEMPIDYLEDPTTAATS